MVIRLGFKKTPNGDWYYFGRNGTTERIIKHVGGHKNTSGVVAAACFCPKSLIGKRCRLKLELIED